MIDQVGPDSDVHREPEDTNEVLLYEDYREDPKNDVKFVRVHLDSGYNGRLEITEDFGYSPADHGRFRLRCMPGTN